MSSYKVVDCQRFERESGLSCVVAVLIWDQQTVLVRQTLGDAGEFSWEQILMYAIRTSDTLETLRPEIDRFFAPEDLQRRTMACSPTLRQVLVDATATLGDQIR